ncbi:MAG TPA: TetR/AcrR family transcriptional regulator [Iamia sp.]|nr:TetR/AcrR family transcriptional regulator [Iamia sp.]
MAEHTDTVTEVTDPADSTRERLIRAAIDIVATEGVAALTTVNVCRRIGIAQSSYYTHFASRDELLQALAERGAAATRRTNRAARLQLAEHPDRAHLRDSMRAPLDLIRSHPEMFRLGRQIRHEPPSTALGAHARAMAAANRSELADDLMDMAGQDDPAVRHRYEMVADCIDAMVSTLGEGHIEGRYPDLEEVIDLLAIYAAGNARLSEWLGWAAPER